LYENLKVDEMKKLILFLPTVLIIRLGTAQTVTQDYDGTSKEHASLDVRDGNNYLGETFNQSECGLNYVQASKHITTRLASQMGAGLPCDLMISGIPTGASIVKAFVWWVVSYTAGSSLAPVIQLTNPIGNTYSDTADVIGTSSHKCWGELGTRTFRTDVTHTVSGNGNYQCNIIGNTVWEIDGVTLMIIYSDSLSNWKGTLIINDGCWTTIGTPLYFGLSNINSCPINSSAYAFVVLSDMQSTVNPPVHLVQVDSNSASFSNGFWNFDKVNSSSLLIQQTNADFFVIPHQNDCWCWAVAGVYLKSDSCSGCGIIGMYEAESAIKDISVSPNPATDKLRVYFSEILVELIEIYNVMGEKVSFVPIPSSRKDRYEVVNVSHLNPGIFFLKLNAGAELLTLKFVKQ
jgi:hypothetical protein